MIANIFQTWVVYAKIDEEFIRAFLRMIDKEHIIREVRLVPVFDYGSEGSEPYEGTCPESGDGSSMSCVSGSGSSMCGCYMGHADEYVVECSSTKIRKAVNGGYVWVEKSK
jgi:hypothetical protein